MPTPKRWHPVSRDLNEDPELWALTEQFGDRSLRLWLEILSLIDRHENRWRVSGDWVGTLSRKCRVFGKKVSAVIAWLIKNEWLCVEETDENGSPLILASRNYWKYHKRREPSEAALGSDQGSTKNQDVAPSYPNLSDPTRTRDKRRDEKTSASVERPAAEMMQPKTHATWEAYREAYVHRYQTPPVRNAKVNGTLARLVDRLGAEDAPKVAMFYLTCDDPFYIKVNHSTDAMLRDAEGLHTQMVTGRRTTTSAKSLVGLL